MRQAAIDLPATPVAVSAARKFLGKQCRDLAADLVEDAELLVSELVTNAIRHGQPSIELRIRLLPSVLTVEVYDSGPGDPVLPADEQAHDQPSGRGLRLVAAIASEWGVSHPDSGPGKVVWFTLRSVVRAPTAGAVLVP